MRRPAWKRVCLIHPDASFRCTVFLPDCERTQELIAERCRNRTRNQLRCARSAPQVSAGSRDGQVTFRKLVRLLWRLAIHIQGGFACTAHTAHLL